MYIGVEEDLIYIYEEDSIYTCIQVRRRLQYTWMWRRIQYIYVYIYIPSRRTICYMHVCSIENTFYVLHRRTKRWSQQCASQSQGSWPYIENKVGHCLFFFQAHQRLVTTMRIIGGGFVAMTFDSEFTCQKARDQVFVCLYVSFLCMQVSFQCMQVSFDTI